MRRDARFTQLSWVNGHLVIRALQGDIGWGAWPVRQRVTANSPVADERIGAGDGLVARLEFPVNVELDATLSQRRGNMMPLAIVVTVIALHGVLLQWIDTKGNSPGVSHVEMPVMPVVSSIGTVLSLAKSEPEDPSAALRVRIDPGLNSEGVATGFAAGGSDIGLEASVELRGATATVLHCGFGSQVHAGAGNGWIHTR